MRSGDIFVYCDISGAAVAIVKNHKKGISSLPPPKTMTESGMFSICFSRAWEAKIVTSAWWIEAAKVHKTTENSSEILSPGIFRIDGEKNYLPPTPINISFGFLFVLNTDERAEMTRKRIELEASVEALNELLEEKLILDYCKKDSSFSINTGAEVKTKTENVPLLIEPKIELKAEIKTQDVEVKKPVRGKHGKEKKMKKKYADQDEEERALRLELLGSVNKKKSEKTDEKKIKNTNLPANTKAEKNNGDNGKIRKVEKAQFKSDEIAEGDLQDESLGENEGDGSISADYFTACPESGKSYLFAIPVCSPTTAISSAAFRLKLIPGNLKKGKAVKSAVEILTKDCTVADWCDLIKAVPADEMIRLLPAKVGIASSDGSGKRSASKRRQKKPKN
jgi:hypothetical protein